MSKRWKLMNVWKLNLWKKLFHWDLSLFFFFLFIFFFSLSLFSEISFLEIQKTSFSKGCYSWSAINQVSDIDNFNVCREPYDILQMDFRRGISIGITGTLGVLKLGGLSKFRFRCHSQVVSSFLRRIFKSRKELLSLVTNSAQIIYNMLRNSFFSFKI